MTPTQAESIARALVEQFECDWSCDGIATDNQIKRRKDGAVDAVARALLDATRQTDLLLQCAVGALEEAEAILGGEYGDKYGVFCELMASLRKEADAILSSNKTRVEGGGIMNKCHKINPAANTMPDWYATFCGLTGMKERYSDDEYTGVQGYIFEATTGTKGVTCAKCRKGRWTRTDDPTSKGLHMAGAPDEQ